MHGTPSGMSVAPANNQEISFLACKTGQQSSRVSFGRLNSHCHVGRDLAPQHPEASPDDRNSLRALHVALERGYNVPVPVVSQAVPTVRGKMQRPGADGDQRRAVGPGPVHCPAQRGQAAG
jgi:hypothetical protein